MTDNFSTRTEIFLISGRAGRGGVLWEIILGYVCHPHVLQVEDLLR